MQHQLEPPTQMALASGHMVEELFVVLRGLRRGWYYIAISAVVCLALGLVYAYRATTSYQATARLLILEQGGRLLPGPGGVPFQAGGGSENSLSTHVMIIRSPIVAEQAIENGRDQGADRRSLIDHLAVTIPDSTAKVLQIVYTAGTRQEASQVMDAVIDSYEKFLKNNYQKNTGKTIELFIKARDELSERRRHDGEGVPGVPPEEPVLHDRRRGPVARQPPPRAVGGGGEPGEGPVVPPPVGAGAGAQAAERGGGRGHRRRGPEPGDAVEGGGRGRPGTSGDAPATSYELLGVELERVAFQRATAARLLDHLRADLEGASSATDGERRGGRRGVLRRAGGRDASAPRSGGRRPGSTR